MGCGGDREKGPPEHTQKWEFITLSDFKATSAWTILAYIWLWSMALVGVAVYAVDTFTAVNLLVFNKWSGAVEPKVPLKYSKWIFAACILLSWVLCFYEWFRAMRVIRRGGVAESYMDPLAVNLQSMRPKGWKRFLVFTELTKSKKGADYIAFFVYFAFNSAIRVILAEGPRQAINAMTLYAAMDADLIHGSSKATNSVSQFFQNVQILAQTQEQQAIILFSMLFTLVIWVFSALSLILATIFYLAFLWHYIPQRDGRLSVYCRRKIDRRLEKIVAYKIKAAIEDDERKKRKAEEKAELKRKKTGDTLNSLSPPSLIRQPTLPQVASPEVSKEDKLPEFGLARMDTSITVSTLRRYESRPPTRDRQRLQRQPTLPDLAESRPEMPSRMGTQGSQWSNASYQSDAPLLANAGYAGEAGRASPAPGVPSAAYSRQGSNASFARPTPSRTMTQGSQATQGPFTPMSRMDTVGSQQRAFSPASRMDTIGSQQRAFSPMSGNGSVRPPPGQRFPVRSNTGFSFDTEPQSAVSPMTPLDPYGRPMGPPMRQNTQESFRTAQMSRQDSQAPTFGQPMARRPTYGSLHSQKSSFSRPIPKPSQLTPANSQPFAPAQVDDPASSEDSYEMTSHQPPYTTQAPAHTEPTPAFTGYTAFNPSLLSPTSSTPPAALQPGPKRDITVAGQPGAANNYFGTVSDVPQRSATAPIDPRHTTGYGDIISSYNNDLSARSSISPPAHVGHASSICSPDEEFRQPSLPSEPMPSLTRTQVVSPMGASSVGVPSSIYSSGDMVLRSPDEVRGPSPPMPVPDRAYTGGTRFNDGGRTESWEAGPANRF